MAKINIENFLLEDPKLMEITDDAASKIVGGSQVVKVFEPHKVGLNWFVPFISENEGEYCLGLTEIRIDEVGGWYIAGTDTDVYCITSA